jgi:uncharacterized protein
VTPPARAPARRGRSHLVVGVISDTHGLLREEAVRALQGSDLIIHAGDVGHPEVLQGLGRIAPTFAVRGNNDRGEWATALPASEVVAVGESAFYVLHELAELDLDAAAAGFAAVISGHSHSPSIETRKGVLYLNPGSAGPRRFRLPVTVATVAAQPSRLVAKILHLPIAS